MNRVILVPQPKIYNSQKGILHIGEETKNQIFRYLLGNITPEIISYAYIKPEEAKHGAEWYRLEITESQIHIISITEKGIFYGMQTLKQIIRQFGGSGIPCTVIEDWPDFATRGVLYDISRDRVPTLNCLKKLINWWSEWKYNQVQLYMEHTFAYSQHETVWKEASPLSADDVKYLSSYCKARGIDLLPNQNSFGHMERWLQHDEYASLAESPNGFYDPWGEFRKHSSTLSPAVKEAIPFLSALYDELLPNFESDYINIGGDEPWELGKGRSKALCDKQGLDRVYMKFLLEIYKLVKLKGKKIQIYGDIIMKYPHLVKELPKDVILVNWGYEKYHPFKEECRKISNANIPFYVCTGNSAWNSLGGRWNNTRENIINGAVQGYKFGAEGFLVSEWGDNGHWQQITAGIPGFILGGCAAWNLEAARNFDIESILAVHVFNGDVNQVQALMNLQHVWEQSGTHLHNMSLPAALLLDPSYPYYRSEFEKFRAYDFLNETALIDQALDLLTDSEGADVNDFSQELRFTALLLRHGCILGKKQLLTEHIKIEEIPAEGINELLSDLEPLIEEYSRLWLKHSRPGGLKDSVSRLEKLKQKYKTISAVNNKEINP
ncbi:MAG: beta-N-acetylhexosaminidase [Spirochaetia bacterium]|nr:beta-N-acetylhexosaminidase [Spirochaetia bacterium]MCF7952464.1 beta-N-acetylhexosaminidase [Spirochaetales bacterium]